MATNTLLGIFDDPQAARRALERLQSSGLAIDDVSIVSRATTTGAAVSNADDVSAGEGAAVGAVWGGLIGLAALLIPGIGRKVNGARRWIPLFILNLQPSELMKLFVILYGADYAVRKQAVCNSNSFVAAWPMGLIELLPPTLFSSRQPTPSV